MEESLTLRPVPRIHRLSFLLKMQGPLLCLMLFISIIYLFQAVLAEDAFDGFMVTPDEIVAQWHSLSWASAGKFSTLLTYAFLHGDFMHLFGNMLYLWIFAALAVELLGHKWMFITFVFTAICGGICHVALNPDSSITMLGASGAVTGFEGLYLGMAVRWLLPDPHVWPIARPIPPLQLAALGVLGFILDFMGVMGAGEGGIAYGAHLGGFISGMLLGAAVVPMPRVALPR